MSIYQAEDLGVLRFITAGSVDDGKSTLIGRLLYDSKAVLSDQLSAISRAKNKRTVGDEIDLSLLTDGLEAEREQGITIDVAYRYFATAKRKFIIADTPGHEQYTRNMVTGASTAHAAIILVDATRVTFVDGVAQLLPQTKRHSAIVKLLGLQHVIVAINKMDLVDYSETRFNEIRDAYVELARQLGITNVRFVPVSALKGDNIVTASERMPWYAGEPLLDLLEALPVTQPTDQALRFPVQWVARQDGSQADDFRGYMGRVEAGEVPYRRFDHRAAREPRGYRLGDHRAGAGRCRAGGSRVRRPDGDDPSRGRRRCVARRYVRAARIEGRAVEEARSGPVLVRRRAALARNASTC